MTVSSLYLPAILCQIVDENVSEITRKQMIFVTFAAVPRQKYRKSRVAKAFWVEEGFDQPNHRGTTTRNNQLSDQFFILHDIAFLNEVLYIQQLIKIALFILKS